MKMVIGLVMTISIVLSLTVLSDASVVDSMEISVTPITSYAIQISTPASGLQFSPGALDTAYVHEVSATVKNNGVITADWTIKGVAMNTWTLGTASLNDTGLDKMVLAAQLNSTAINAGTFTDSDVVTTLEKDADTNNFAGDQNGNNVTSSSIRHLWIYVKMPTDTSVDNEQRFRLEIKAYPSNRL